MSADDPQNTFEKPETVVPQVSQLSAADFEKKGGWNVRKHSWAFLIFDGQLA
jgi:alpha-N-arabinofuranosidase